VKERESSIHDLPLEGHDDGLEDKWQHLCKYHIGEGARDARHEVDLLLAGDEDGALLEMPFEDEFIFDLVLPPCAQLHESESATTFRGGEMRDTNNVELILIEALWVIVDELIDERRIL
jgi:hypothetical protein